MSSKLRQKKTGRTNTAGITSGGGRARMSEKQRQKNRRLMILSVFAILAGIFMSINQSLNNGYAAACSWQETARTEASALKTAAEEFISSEEASGIADSEAGKSMRDASGRITDDAGIPELYAAVGDLKEAVSLLRAETENGGTAAVSGIETVSAAAEKTEKALIAANEQAKAFNESRGKVLNRIFASTLGLPEMETF